jgi:hypothetical protein
MDCGGTPRLAFGHLASEEGLDDDALTVDVMAGISGDKLCSISLTEQEPVQHLKMLIWTTLNVPETDQVLLLPNGRRLGAKRRLRSVLPSRSASVTLVVSRPACRCCGVRDGLWGRRAKLTQCAHCLEAYYCSRECMIADWERHVRSGV